LAEPGPPQPRGLPEALRAAIERTLSSLGDAGAASAADLPAEALGRAGELLDEVARRGQDAAETSAAITGRVIDAVAETLRRRSKPKVEGE